MKWFPGLKYLLFVIASMSAAGAVRAGDQTSPRSAISVPDVPQNDSGAGPTDPSTSGSAAQLTPSSTSPSNVPPKSPDPAPLSSSQSALAGSWAARALHKELMATLDRPPTPPERDSKNEAKALLDEKRVSAYRKKIALAAGGSKHELKARLALAAHYRASGKAQAVIEVLRPAMASLSRKGLLLLAEAYHEKKEYLDETRVLETLIARDKNDHVAHHLLAVTHAASGRRDEALKKYEAAKKINPKYLPPQEELLREAKRAGFLHDSIQAVQDMIENFGPRARFISELCLLYAHEAFFDKALEVCKDAITRDPKRDLNHVILALVVREKDGPDASEKIFRQAAKQFPRSEPAQWAAGEITLERGNYPSALTYFRRAVKAGAGSARAWNGLARSAFELKKLSEALKAFERTCALERGSMKDFHKATSLLRNRSDLLWVKRFEAGLAKCVGE